MMSRRLHGREIAAHVNDAKGSATSKCLHTLDTVPIMAVGTIVDCIEGLLDGRGSSNKPCACWVVTLVRPPSHATP